MVRNITQFFFSKLNGEASGSCVRVTIPAYGVEGYPRSRSRSPTVSRKDNYLITSTNELIGKRVAKYVGNTILFGNVVERIRGAVIAKTTGNIGTRV